LTFFLDALTKWFMKPKAIRDPAIAKIRATRGMMSRVALITGLSRQAVAQWTRVRADLVLDVAPLINMRPEQIRPDIFKRSKKRGET